MRKKILARVIGKKVRERNRMGVEKSQRVPLANFFGIVRLFLKTIFPKGSHFKFLKMICNRMYENLKASPRTRQFGPTFGFSGAAEENTLTFGSPFAIFEP